ncbi:SDR family NAD(P)-dependent oxidoreductase [Streptomyces aurantiogriseus]|uniref:Oxidoreductase n=1 Tax=Streptomyces aurantiogriseus TaxID=66870 RepID=A0A918FPA6_9ACTN|nr:SDR family NAD(P)-dependent oxidoreductase [Streptomyces aurantiogriseus]GGR63774.1 oxidoreductase [Streptomyces aurantiogriseus]
MSASEYADLTAVSTGDASGIGPAKARLPAARGAPCLGLKPDDVPTPPADMPTPPADVADLTDLTDLADAAGLADAAVRAAVEEAARRLGSIHILADNAGIGAQPSIEADTDDERRPVFGANAFATVRVSRAAPPHRRRSRSAATVSTRSTAATAGLPDRAPPSSTQDASAPLIHATAAGPVHRGIRVNCANPATADTPWTGRPLDRATGPTADAQPRPPTSRGANLSPPPTPPTPPTPTPSPSPSRALRARSPVPQALTPPPTQAPTHHGSGPAPGLPHETARKENQP